MDGVRRDARTVIRYLARDVLEAIDRVDDLEVMLGHVQVTVGKILGIPLLGYGASVRGAK